MRRYFHIFLCMVILTGFFTSCQAKKDLLTEGSRSQAVGDKMDANQDYEKAYPQIKDPRKAGDVAKRIAANYQDAGKLDKAITWYREAVNKNNSIQRTAPYGELVSLYLIQDNLEEADKTLAEIEQKKTKDWTFKAIEVSRMLLRHTMLHRQWDKADKYAWKLRLLGTMTGQKNIVTEADIALSTINQASNESYGKKPGVASPEKK